MVHLSISLHKPSPSVKTSTTKKGEMSQKTILCKPTFSPLKIRRLDTQSFAYLTKGRYTYLFNSPRSQELFPVFPNQIYQLQDLHSKIVITNTPLFPLETGLWGQVLRLPIQKSKAANNGHRPQWPLTRSLPKSAFGRPVSRFDLGITVIDIHQ